MRTSYEQWTDNDNDRLGVSRYRDGTACFSTTDGRLVLLSGDQVLDLIAFLKGEDR